MGRDYFVSRRIGEASAKHFLKRSWNFIVMSRHSKKVGVSRWLQLCIRSKATNKSRSSSCSSLQIGITLVRFYIGYFGVGFLAISLLAVCSIEISIRSAYSKRRPPQSPMELLRQYCLIMIVMAADGGYLGAYIFRTLNPRFYTGTGGLYWLGHGGLFLVPAELK